MKFSYAIERVMARYPRLTVAEVVTLISDAESELNETDYCAEDGVTLEEVVDFICSDACSI